MSPDPKRIRLELDKRRARGVHAAIREALNAQLLSGDHLDAAREVLEQLNGRVPGWLQAGPIGGEAGYLVAAEAVLRALVDAEDRGRRSLTETELLRELGDAKPLGSTAGDVLARMRREKFVTVNSHNRDEPWISAASAGRRFLHRDTAVCDETWVVRDYNALLDLVYAEHRPGERGHRPSIQAIGRLEDSQLADALIGVDLLKAPDVPVSLATWLELTSKGSGLARERWQQSAPPGVRRYSFDHPPAPPLPFRRRLALRIDRDDRVHPVGPTYGGWCSPGVLAAALQQDQAVRDAQARRRSAVDVQPLQRHVDRLPTGVHRCRRARVRRPGRRHVQPPAVAPGLPLELRVMTPATVTEQRTTALALANEARLDKAGVRRDLRNGALTLARVAATRPPSLCPMTLFALVLELPGFGSRRLEKLNRRALEGGINLALTLGGASTRTLRWLVREVTGQRDVEVALIPRDADWMDVALALDTLVLEHERCVHDESLPAERWAWADERLHRDHKRVMDRAPVREDDATGDEEPTTVRPADAERNAGQAQP